MPLDSALKKETKQIHNSSLLHLAIADNRKPYRRRGRKIFFKRVRETKRK